MTNFDKTIQRIDESLRDWFKSHRDKRTGKKFKGWVNCRTGGPCSSKSKGGKYPVCRPTHAQCKPIKHKMHKKTGHKRVQWKENINENYFPVQTSFIHLPDTAPYGFWVWNNKYVIANYQGDHPRILREIMPSEYLQLGEVSLEAKAFTLGLIRMVREDETYHIDYIKGSPAALKLAQDIAEFYGKTIRDPYKQKPKKELPPSPPSEDKNL